ncbi:MAG TPA: hypothetical protein VFM18_24420 [Methanosarcina sp.]|nr:hypothetical protein [Methanosarcina sp.]
MSNKTVEYKSSGIFLPLLTTLFIGLKLTGHITWSWFWVLSPLWIPVAIVLVFALICLTVAGILVLLER